MKSKAFRMTMLFDFYGELLTPRQQELFDLYYNEDLSLAEIAENEGISRQGVRDVLMRAEAIMMDMEDKTGIVKRFLSMKTLLERIETDAHEILELNIDRFQNAELMRLAQDIQTCVDELKE